MDYNKMPTNSFEHFYLSWIPDKSKLKRPFYLTLANALEADIVSGKLVPGTKLPPQRELADYLDLNFTTVTQAYNLCRERQLMMLLGAEGVFVGSGIFKSGDPAKRAAAIVKAVTNYQDYKMIAELSCGLGEAMVGINPAEIKIIMEERGI